MWEQDSPGQGIRQEFRSSKSLPTRSLARFSKGRATSMLLAFTCLAIILPHLTRNRAAEVARSYRLAQQPRQCFPVTL